MSGSDRNSIIVGVSGANGFIGSEVVRQLLASGFHVKGSVRSLKNKAKWEFLNQLPGSSERLRLVEADLLTENSFDILVKDCTYVIHLASPVTFTSLDPQKEIIEPALKGTENILNSILKFKSTVKRVILTSSVAAVVNLGNLGNDSSKIYNEQDWNLTSSLTDGPYRYSKRLAEEYAWKWYQTSGVELVTILPSFVIGKVHNPKLSFQELNFSLSLVMKLINGETKNIPVGGPGFVDVEDVARAHVLALENPAAPGNRFLTVEASHSWEEICALLKTWYPEKPIPVGAPDLNQGFAITTKFLVKYDNSKICQVMGMKFKSLQVSLQETVQSLILHNFISHSHFQFSFGVITDVQYADKENINHGNDILYFRDSLKQLETCISSFWNKEPLNFTVHLGDIIDGNISTERSMTDLDQVLKIFALNQNKHYHVLGNHCLRLPRKYVIEKLGFSEPAYSYFDLQSWRFVILDGTDISLYGRNANSPQYLEAQEYLNSHPLSQYPHAQTWNSKIGSIQLSWLRNTLKEAKEAGKKVICFNHFPLLSKAASEEHLLWNSTEVIQLFEDRSISSVVAFFCGHFHKGGYCEQNGIHYLTVKGAVECPPDKTCYIGVYLYENRIEIQGFGIETNRILPFKLE